MSNWVQNYYRHVDGMNLESFLDQHTDDAWVQFGNNPLAVGKEQIGQAIGGFWSMIGGMRHNTVNLWFTDDGTGVFESNITYSTKGGTDVDIPCTSVLTERDGKVSSLRVYIDLAPLFEKIGAESAPVG
jgi:ketosteroid isomerase-like protein